MPEPTAAVTFVAVGGVVPVITLLGAPLGLDVKLLFAGFVGALAAMALLNTVPGTGDTWPELLRTTVKRMGIAVASSLTAAYLTPLLPWLITMPEPLVATTAFVVGGGAKRVLTAVIERFGLSVEQGAKP